MEFEPPRKYEEITTYNRDYVVPYPPICKTKEYDFNKKNPDFLCTRIPINDFEYHPYTSNKFMDDHLVDISPTRQKINFFRQLRYVACF